MDLQEMERVQATTALQEATQSENKFKDIDERADSPIQGDRSPVRNSLSIMNTTLVDCNPQKEPSSSKKMSVDAIDRVICTAVARL